MHAATDLNTKGVQMGTLRIYQFAKGTKHDYYLNYYLLSIMDCIIEASTRGLDQSSLF